MAATAVSITIHCINRRADDPQIANCLQEYLPTGSRSNVTFSGEAYTHVYADIKAIFAEVAADPYHANKLQKLLQAWACEAMYVSAAVANHYWADDITQTGSGLEPQRQPQLLVNSNPSLIEGIPPSFLIVLQLFNMLPLLLSLLTKFISCWLSRTRLPFVLVYARSCSRSRSRLFSFTIALIHCRFHCCSLSFSYYHDHSLSLQIVVLLLSTF